ncbi:MAG: ankyrin repeat domain-containing protein [Acidobacteria bacterium]|nr:ankyrin repeat domain-containing protein [Acidobacteriota bacterium]
MPRWPKRKPRPGVDEYGRTPLWKFAFAGDEGGVRRELATGADPSAGDDAGYTPLHVAVQEGRIEVVKLLLRLGADPNRVDKYGNGALWTAVYQGYRSDRTEANLTIVRLLLRSGANADHKNAAGRTPREFAIEAGDESLKSLFVSGNKSA